MGFKKINFANNKSNDVKIHELSNENKENS